MWEGLYALFGAVIGGAISALTSYHLAKRNWEHQQEQWKREKQLRYLQEKRARLVQVLPNWYRLFQQVAVADANNTAYDAPPEDFLIAAEIPGNVIDQALDMLESRTTTELSSITCLQKEMQKALRDLDKQIEALLELENKSV